MKTREISCSEVLAPIECINPRRDRWAVRWNHHRDEERGWLAVEMITDGRPTVDEIRDAVAEYFDAQTQNRIANTFFWNGRMVRLTDAAQRNFLFAVYSLDKTGEIDRAPFIGLLEADTDWWRLFGGRPQPTNWAIWSQPCGRTSKSAEPQESKRKTPSITPNTSYNEPVKCFVSG